MKNKIFNVCLSIALITPLMAAYEPLVIPDTYLTKPDDLPALTGEQISKAETDIAAFLEMDIPPCKTGVGFRREYAKDAKLNENGDLEFNRYSTDEKLPNGKPYHSLLYSEKNKTGFADPCDIEELEKSLLRPERKYKRYHHSLTATIGGDKIELDPDYGLPINPNTKEGYIVNRGELSQLGENVTEGSIYYTFLDGKICLILRKEETFTDGEIVYRLPGTYVNRKQKNPSEYVDAGQSSFLSHLIIRKDYHAKPSRPFYTAFSYARDTIFKINEYVIEKRVCTFLSAESVHCGPIPGLKDTKHAWEATDSKSVYYSPENVSKIYEGTDFENPYMSPQEAEKVRNQKPNFKKNCVVPLADLYNSAAFEAKYSGKLYSPHFELIKKSVAAEGGKLLEMLRTKEREQTLVETASSALSSLAAVFS